MVVEEQNLRYAKKFIKTDFDNKVNNFLLSRLSKFKYSKAERMSFYNSIKNKLSDFSHDDIENGIMLYCLVDYGCNACSYDSEKNRNIARILASSHFPTDLETITEFFESLLEQDSKNENGIVFTPQYIAEYMINSMLSNVSTNKEMLSVIDPGCGCGIFLIAVAEAILNVTDKSIDTIIEKNIYGIDIVKENVKRCKLILKLLSAKHGGDFENIQPNIICEDSLKINWNKIFNLESFDCVIGNPPYVNPHDMNKETVKFLKNNFYSTQSGVFNIYYAFIEKGMKELSSKGILSYIIPNNFLTIKSALDLREYLQKNLFIKSILDFGDNMVFKPVRTYNCIIQLSKKNNLVFDYNVLPKVDNVESIISNTIFDNLETSILDKNGWKLVDKKTYNNLQKIENQFVPIGNFIRTGIATLRDNAYIVEKDNKGYYKIINSEKIYIEHDLVKPLYKVSDLKLYDNMEDAKRYIIFPYTRTKADYKLLNEKSFISKYPKTYKCLKMQRKDLDSRDKGKGARQGWYAYGRTQGLNKYGKKLLFPTFANKPKFMYAGSEEALFCNGYAVFENERYDLDILLKVLNSRLMDYYVSNTSYSIEGGYYCYQKKYVERFSLPWFSEEQLSFIRKASNDDLDDFLWDLYDLE